MTVVQIYELLTICQLKIMLCYSWFSLSFSESRLLASKVIMQVGSYFYVKTLQNHIVVDVIENS